MVTNDDSRAVAYKDLWYCSIKFSASLNSFSRRNLGGRRDDLGAQES